MAILKGFPPSNTISCVTRIDPDAFYYSNPWIGRKDRLNRDRIGITDIAKYFGHAVDADEMDDLLEVSHACHLTFDYKKHDVFYMPWFVYEGYNLSVQMNPKYGEYYLKRYDWMKTDRFCNDMRAKGTTQLMPQVRAKLIEMGWHPIAEYACVGDDIKQVGERLVSPAYSNDPKDNVVSIKVAPGTKRKLLEAIARQRAKKVSQENLA